MNTLAIDPGASGGLAWTDKDGTQCLAMPPTDGDILDLLRSIKAAGVDTCYIEQVGGYVGGTGQPGAAMFRFGESCGYIRGCLMALSFKVVMVRPQKWQKHFSLGTAKQAGGKTAWKNKLKGEAQRRFPNQTVTLKTSDSLLMLDYAITTEKNV